MSQPHLFNPSTIRSYPTPCSLTSNTDVGTKDVCECIIVIKLLLEVQQVSRVDRYGHCAAVPSTCKSPHDPLMPSIAYLDWRSFLPCLTIAKHSSCERNLTKRPSLHWIANFSGGMVVMPCAVKTSI